MRWKRWRHSRSNRAKNAPLGTVPSATIDAAVAEVAAEASVATTVVVAIARSGLRAAPDLPPRARINPAQTRPLRIRIDARDARDLATPATPRRPRPPRPPRTAVIGDVMANYNKIILVGNLTRDPQLRYLPSQTAVVDFGLAVNHRFKT